ncbi:MAG: hypothetical protein QG574_2239 [Cyanobacteriota bacterium erpe_2018_sw_21hr_WHONDRS-SW48-000092_B_bin.40]|nr:hypothetical protein [Cyanobacteriota bacterium erpe_2018_sw_21hr_WHONDRS-SW48-000092_B_bin.40]
MMSQKRRLIVDANEQLIASCLPEFNSRVPDEEAAIDLILELQVRQGKLACRCGYEFVAAIRERYERTVKCLVCRKYTHFTVGTLYEGVRSVRARLGAVWLMDHGAVVTSTKLHQLFGIATSTGLAIINTIGLFIESLRGQSWEDVSEKIGCPNFAEIMIRRSRITGAYEHPSSVPETVSVADVDHSADEATEQYSHSEDSFDDLGDLDKKILAEISGVPVSVDVICKRVDQPAGPVGAALTMLEILGHIASAPGNFFVRLTAAKQDGAKVEFSPQLRRFIEEAIENIKAVRQGVSRKYLQLYLGAFWCHFDRDSWRVGSLMLVTLDSSLSPDRDLIVYESPLMVSVVSG